VPSEERRGERGRKGGGREMRSWDVEIRRGERDGDRARDLEN
jgi:hypothetical protein